jgi:hypothetical protein
VLCVIDLSVLCVIGDHVLNSARIFVEAIMYLAMEYNYYIRRIHEIHNLY